MPRFAVDHKASSVRTEELSSYEYAPVKTWTQKRPTWIWPNNEWEWDQSYRKQDLDR